MAIICINSRIRLQYAPAWSFLQPIFTPTTFHLCNAWAFAARCAIVLYMKAWLQQQQTGADWYNLPSDQRSPLQRMAAQSLGIITIGNAATLIGAGLTLIGLFLAFGGSLHSGLIMAAVGRLLDIFDGHLARHTKTSSPVGEALDAGFDKLTVVVAMTLFLLSSDMPVALIFVLLLVEEITTAAITIWARRQGIVVHPSRLGKYTTFCLWTAVLLMILAGALFSAWETVFIGLFVLNFGLILASITLLLRWWTLAQYIQTIRQARRAKEL